MAVRTYRDVACELEKRIGVRLSHVRVQQICAQAEKKLSLALSRLERELLTEVA